MVKNIIRFEGFCIFLASVYLYYALQGNWLIFIALLFSPDFSMLGYLKSPKLGAITYNIVHNYILAIIIFFIGFIHENLALQYTGLILAAHVGLDRFLGFGLKYPTHFKVTHIQKL